MGRMISIGNFLFIFLFIIYSYSSNLNNINVKEHVNLYNIKNKDFKNYINQNLIKIHKKSLWTQRIHETKKQIFLQRLIKTLSKEIEISEEQIPDISNQKKKEKRKIWTMLD